MSIADKLEYLYETKIAIRDAIRAKGVVVSDTDTLRSYVHRINSINLTSEGTLKELADFLHYITGNTDYFAVPTYEQAHAQMVQAVSEGYRYFCIITINFVANGGIGTIYLFYTRGTDIHASPNGVLTSDTEMFSFDSSGGVRNRGRILDWSMYQPVIKRESYKVV